MSCMLTGVASGQPEFTAPIERVIGELRRRFSGSLIAYYVGGSVARGEALPYHSDVDSFAILGAEPTADDRAWKGSIEEAVRRDHPQVKDYHINLWSRYFMRNETLLFIFRYNAHLAFGRDVVTECERQGDRIPSPNGAWAKKRIGWMEKCFDGLVRNDFPAELYGGAIPSVISAEHANDFYISRKLARNYMLLDGAYYLMAKNAFKTFAISDVMPNLQRLLPQWKTELEITCLALMRCNELRISPIPYRRMIVPVVRNFIDDIARTVITGPEG